LILLLNQSLAIDRDGGTARAASSRYAQSVPLRVRANAFRHTLLLITLLLSPFVQTFAAEVIPPKPPNHFNDYANVISAATEQELNTRLKTAEQETSNQILVVIYPKMESDSSVQDYTVRIANAWEAGLKEKRNGAILFVFVNDRQMFLQIGYGLEGAIPDAIAKQITEFEIKPHFKTGNYDAGLRAGVNAILQAARGEYKGTGRTVAQQNQQNKSALVIFIFFIIFFLIIAASTRRSRRGGRVYRRSGWGPVTWGGGDWGGGSWGGGGGGGSWGGGGGSFSSGGGSFGGGGAGSSW
jgi:uncharacterized protein